MPYAPHGLAESDRNFAYTALWIGLPASTLLLASQLFGLDRIAIFAGGVTSGTLIGLAFAGRLDEYARAQLGIAARWALAMGGVMLLLSLPPSIGLPDIPSLTALAVIAVTFHLALAIVRLRQA